MIVIGKEDKKGITASMANTYDGKLLPLQLIYQGKIDRSLPEKEARAQAEALGWLFSRSANYWCVVETLQEWTEKVSRYFQCLPISFICLIEVQMPISCAVSFNACMSVHTTFIRPSISSQFLLYADCTSPLQSDL